jgi:hypothetical protein
MVDLAQQVPVLLHPFQSASCEISCSRDQTLVGIVLFAGVRQLPNGADAYFVPAVELLRLPNGRDWTRCTQVPLSEDIDATVTAARAKLNGPAVLAQKIGDQLLELPPV